MNLERLKRDLADLLMRWAEWLRQTNSPATAGGLHLSAELAESSTAADRTQRPSKAPTEGAGEGPTEAPADTGPARSAGGPPEHWLALVRSRAPQLLERPEWSGPPSQALYMQTPAQDEPVIGGLPDPIPSATRIARGLDAMSDAMSSVSATERAADSERQGPEHPDAEHPDVEHSGSEPPSPAIRREPQRVDRAVRGRSPRSAAARSSRSGPAPSIRAEAGRAEAGRAEAGPLRRVPGPVSHVIERFSRWLAPAAAPVRPQGLGSPGRTLISDEQISDDQISDGQWTPRRPVWAPSLGQLRPESGSSAGEPSSDTQAPGSNTEAPRSSTEAPCSSTDVPQFRTEAPCSSTDAPQFGTEVPRSSSHGSRFRTQVPRSQADAATSSAEATETRPQVSSGELDADRDSAESVASATPSSSERSARSRLGRGQALGDRNPGMSGRAVSHSGATSGSEALDDRGPLGSLGEAPAEFAPAEFPELVSTSRVSHLSAPIPTAPAAGGSLRIRDSGMSDGEFRVEGPPRAPQARRDGDIGSPPRDTRGVEWGPTSRERMRPPERRVAMSLSADLQDEPDGASARYRQTEVAVLAEPSVDRRARRKEARHQARRPDAVRRSALRWADLEAGLQTTPTAGEPASNWPSLPSDPMGPPPMVVRRYAELSRRQQERRRRVDREQQGLPWNA